MADVIVEVAGPGRRAALENLFQLYVHDFSEQWFDTSRGALGEDGLFAPYERWESYWTEPERTAFLIRVDGHLAGFALINEFAHSGLRTDFSIAEFFVARKHRRAGVGRRAAAAIIGARPGQWEIAVNRRNLGAQPFWRCVAGLVAQGAIDELDRNDDLWNGLILRFKVV